MHKSLFYLFILDFALLHVIVVVVVVSKMKQVLTFTKRFRYFRVRAFRWACAHIIHIVTSLYT